MAKNTPSIGTVATCATSLLIGVVCTVAFFDYRLPDAIDRAMQLSMTRAQQLQKQQAAANPPPKIDVFTFAIPTDQKGAMQAARCKTLCEAW